MFDYCETRSPDFTVVKAVSPDYSGNGQRCLAKFGILDTPMMRSRFVKLLAAAGCLLAIGLGLLTFYNAPPKFNLVVVTLDTTRADRIGCYGYSAALTPMLDQ